MILDTNALSAFFDDEAPAVRRVGLAKAIHLPVVVLGEYRFGLLGSRKRVERESTLDSFVQLVAVLAITESTTRHYAEIATSSSSPRRRFPRTMPGSRPWRASMPCRS